jgi:hypothetical protein
MLGKTFFATLYICSFGAISSAVAEPVKLTGAEILAALGDETLYAGAKAEIEQIFQKSGQTIYIEQGQYSQGSWFVEDDKYCSRWPPGTSVSCFVVTRDDATITFISSLGKAFPMRMQK